MVWYQYYLVHCFCKCPTFSYNPKFIKGNKRLVFQFANNLMCRRVHFNRYGISSHLSVRRQSVKQVKGHRAVGAGRIVNLRPTGEVSLMTTLARLYCTSRHELWGKFPKYVKRIKTSPYEIELFLNQCFFNVNV